MFGRALTSTLWGIISDRYGRKPVMIFGTASIVVFNTLFGFSTSFWMAITTRFLLGLMNGVLGSVKAYASEISRPEHQSLALSLVSKVSTAWGIGLIIGPAIGGFLAQPADKFPGIISQDSIFGRFPYLLPCFCISILPAVVCVGSFWLPDRRADLVEEKKNAQEIAKITGEEWKNMSEEARKPYEEVAKNQKEAYAKEMEVYNQKKEEEAATRLQEEDELMKIQKQEALQMLKKKEKTDNIIKKTKEKCQEKRKQKGEKNSDPNKPKRPASSYLLFR